MMPSLWASTTSLRQQHAHREVLGDLAGHVVALHGVDGRVLVGVLLLDFLVVALDEREDLVIGRVALALEVLHVAVDDVLAGDLEAVERHDLVLDHVLDFLDGDGVTSLCAFVADIEGSILDLALGQTLGFGDLLVGGLDRVDDLLKIKGDLRAVSLDDLHIRAAFPCFVRGLFVEPLSQTQYIVVSFLAETQSLVFRLGKYSARGPRICPRLSTIFCGNLFLEPQLIVLPQLEAPL
jgi:hypothetical protein